MDELQKAFDRLRARIDINARGCWIWQGALSKDMYGQIRVGSTVMRTHRLAFLCVNGAIPRGKVIRHTCDEGRCCNPAHLVVGDHEDNTQDIMDRGRQAARRVLNADEIAKLDVMWRAGATKRQIAEALHCNWYAVSRAIDAFGAKVQKTPGRPKGSRNLHPRISDAVKARIAKEYASGKFTQEQLAEKHGCDQTYISLIVRRFSNPSGDSS